MLSYKEKFAILLLDDGTVFKGKQAGIKGTVTGEICFNTGMTGYQEIFTDPSYYNQIVVMTSTHIGNYGIYKEESQADTPMIKGMVCNNYSDGFSRPLANDSLQNLFEQNNIIGIKDIDTRTLVEHIRDKGAMNAIISSETDDIAKLKQQLSSAERMEGMELSSKVSVKAPYTFGDAKSLKKVALIDFGVKRSILKHLAARGLYIKVFPYNTSVKEIKAFSPNGIMLSNGPGDPQSMTKEIATVKELVALDLPIFGICLGHQLLCLAYGLKTFKMFNGHRGCNHPVLNLLTGKGEITSQNHGFVVDDKLAKAHSEIEITHKHLNDNTLAGIRVKNKPIFSVQFHPEASPGPNDANYLFDDFVHNF